MCKTTGIGVDGFFAGSVVLPNGRLVEFVPNVDGGMWNGKEDVNLPGPNGYTYGGVIVSGKLVQGYVCHGTQTFRTQSETGQRLIGQLPELTVEQRRSQAESFPGFSSFAPGF